MTLVDSQQTFLE